MMMSSSSSRHALWYTHLLPATVPVLLLASAVHLVSYFVFVFLCFLIPWLQGLKLTQLTLAHEKYMDHATRRISSLESQLAALRESRKQ